MLVLTRKINESIIIAGDIRVTVIGVQGTSVRLGFEAPNDVSIRREELVPIASEDLGSKPAQPDTLPRDRRRRS